MRSRLKTQMGQRLIQKVQKWVELLEVEARLQKDMESQGANHDRVSFGLDRWLDACSEDRGIRVGLGWLSHIGDIKVGCDRVQCFGDVI